MTEEQPKSIFKTTLRVTIKLLKYLGLLVLILFVLLALVLTKEMSGVILPWERQEAIETAQLWGKLAPFPKDAKVTSLEQHPGMFSHIYEIEFTAPIESIDLWLKNSEGLKSKEPVLLSPNLYEYKVSNKDEGAVWGRVEVDRVKLTVKMSIHWS